MTIVGVNSLGCWSKRACRAAFFIVFATTDIAIEYIDSRIFTAKAEHVAKLD